MSCLKLIEKLLTISFFFFDIFVLADVSWKIRNSQRQSKRLSAQDKSSNREFIAGEITDGVLLPVLDWCLPIHDSGRYQSKT